MEDRDVKYAEWLIKEGEKAEAGRILAAVLRQDPTNAEAWVAASRIAPTLEQRIYCLRKVIDLSTYHAPWALQELENLRRAGVQFPAPQPSPPPASSSPAPEIRRISKPPLASPSPAPEIRRISEPVPVAPKKEWDDPAPVPLMGDASTGQVADSPSSRPYPPGSKMWKSQRRTDTTPRLDIAILVAFVAGGILILLGFGTAGLFNVVTREIIAALGFALVGMGAILLRIKRLLRRRRRWWVKAIFAGLFDGNGPVADD